MVSSARINSFAPCAGLLRQVDSALLDCVSDDLALLLAQAGVADVRAPFAADWDFCTVAEVDGLPRLRLPPDDQAERLGHRTGLTPVWHDISGDVSGDHADPADVTGTVGRWQRALAGGRAVAVVGDAYHLGWLPYHRNEHMSHGFVVEGLDNLGTTGETVVHVVDPYDNVTTYGRATPVTTKVPLGDLAAALPGGSWAVLAETGQPHPVDPVCQVAANARQIVSAHRDGAFAALVSAHADLGPAAVENLCLQSWLLARDRALHHRWLGDVSAELRAAGLGKLPARFGDTVVARWRRATEIAYLALRRVRAGRAAPPSVLGAVEAALAEEAEVAGWALARVEGVAA